MEASNVNTNINQIIFPKDMELRKVRKKPKKKRGPSKKQIALDKLKQILQSFDAVVNEAKQKGVSIPAELGQLPSNVDEIDSIKEIEALAADLSNRIVQIQALLEKGSSLTQSRGMFGYDLPQPAGIFPVTPQPFLPPTIIPRPAPVLPEPMPETPVVPRPAPPMGGEDTEKDLERIRNEILDKLTPEQRAKAQADLDKDTDALSPSPVVPTVLNLETNSGVKYGNTTFDMTAPVGFYDLFRRYRQFIENLQFNTIKLKEGYFDIPQTKYPGLDAQKNNILRALNSFNSGLNANQIQYIDNNATLSEIEKLLDNTLVMDLEDILKQELKKQKVNVIEVSGGKKASSLEKEQKPNEEFVALLKELRIQSDDLKRAIKESSDIDELEEIKQKLNNELLVELNDGFNSLSGEEKTASLTLYETLKATLNDLEIKAQQKLTGLEALEEPDAPAPAAPDAPMPIEPAPAAPKPKPNPKPKPDPEPVEPPAQPLPDSDDEIDPATKAMKPRKRPKVYNLQDIKNPDLRFLTTYVITDGNFGKSVSDALERIGIDYESIQSIRKYKAKDGVAPKVRKQQKVKGIVIDRGVDPGFFKVRP